MRKDLRLICRTTGVLLASALSFQGCSPSSAKPPLVEAAAAGKTPVAAISCNPSTAKLSPGAVSSIQEHFSGVVARLSSLSARQRDEMFVDRDVKGNELLYSRSAGSPDDFKIEPWSQKDLKKDGKPGTSTERAYADLGLKDEGVPVIVAVIDSAIDIDHEDLKEHIWTNDRTDTDYPGDVHGWNFLGGKNGGVYHTTLELTREVKRMRALKATTTLSAQDQAYLTQLEADFAKGKGDAANKLALRTAARDQLAQALDVLKGANCLPQGGTLEEVKAIQSQNPAILAARDAALISLKQGRDLAWYKTSMDHWAAAVTLNDQYYYNVDFDSSSIVGDDPAKMDDVYGNANVKPEDADEIHATHVSGIIGAIRGRHAGLNGQASNVRIMSLRAVPDGDERDKDIGNAIKFAVDHGARIINMSFGKDYSPHRDYVWQQIRYAASKEVLIVHAAGNDSLDNDATSHYPDREVRDGDRKLLETLPNVIEIGASSVNPDKDLPATFSDYGSRTVDLFAPGAEIYSTVPGNHYAELDGTSMATPEVAGIAALVLSQYPKLTVAQLKDVLMGNVTVFRGLSVLKPNADPSTPDSMVDFGTLSVTGGVANAFEALQAAAKIGN